jgi:HTH-type transcriptional regulator/antitoxin HigA
VSKEQPLFLPPGEVVRGELQKRGWTQADLARVLDRPLPTVNEIIQGKRAIMPEMAVALAAAFGTTAEYWMELESAYRLSRVSGTDPDAIQRRAKLYDLAPIKDMQKRGWIKPVTSVDEIEAELKKFFGVESLDTIPTFDLAARKTDPFTGLTSLQRAWCFRARQLAASLQVAPFQPNRLEATRKDLRRLAAYPSESKRVPEVMAKCGIRFVVVEPLAGGKIDGAAFWLNPTAPVIAVSVRFDRVDAFWFTVMHEFSHITNGDALSIDADLAGDEKTPSLMKDDVERRADEEAATALIDGHEIDSFIRRVGPLYSKERIIQFAHRIKIHPGIIVGQLQHRGEIGYSANREMLAKVRDHLITTAVTDGWGQTISPDVL